MAYATVTQVASEFKGITFSASTAVTDTEVSSFIEQADAMINGYVSARYDTPVSGSASLAILQMICIWLVKSRILSILSVKTPQDKTKQDPDGPSLFKQAIDMLKDIRSGKLVLPDATLSGLEGGMTSFLMNEDIDYDFKVDQDTW